MKLFYSGAILLALFCTNTLLAQSDPSDPFFGETCTSITVGKKASTDGSVITSHTCDGRYRTWLTMDTASVHPKGSKHNIYWGTMKTETPWDQRGLELKGSIPEVEHTFTYLNTAYPCLNEKQLGIGETTIVGPEDLVNKEGMFTIEELERIALQRCTNARNAITLIGNLIKEYGYGDWGECITIADKNEVWQMEIFGEGKKHVGGVWAAQRIPDDQVGVSANISRIGTLDLDNSDYYRASDNVFDVAKKLKRWDGKKPFKFWEIYGGNEKPFSIRDYYILSTLAPYLNLSMDDKELPFSVKPEKKVSVEKVMELYRATYEGTPYDMTQNIKMIKDKKDKDGKVIGKDTIMAPGACPWPTMNTIHMINYQHKNAIKYQRTVAVSWCAYSHIIQLRDWLPDEVGGIAWFAFDNPAESPRIPIYAGAKHLPKGFDLCGQHGYKEGSAIWNYRKANKLATVNWQKTKDTMNKSVLHFQQKALANTKEVEQKAAKMIANGKTDEAKDYITQYTEDYTGSTIQYWQNLENKFWGMFGLGF